MGGSSEIRVLGPVQATGPGGAAVLLGARQRCLLALLALSPGQPVPLFRLVQALWGADPPRTAVRTLHSHVARVRQALTDCGMPTIVTTREPGYCLAIAREAVDACRFEDAVARARLAKGDPEAIVAELRPALSLWQGDALSNAEPEGWAAAEVQRLHETRLVATEELWEAELALGRHELAVVELGRLLVVWPSRERLVGLYMLALYRVGRHTDALEVYQRLRAQLADDMGVDPGPELQQRYAAILRRDATLEVAKREPVSFSHAPAQLPAGVGHFTGRETSISMLDELLGDAGGDTRIAVVSGLAGLGKTSFAVHWAHRVAERFDGGQLIIDLRGHDPASAVPTDEALANILRALGVPATRLPADLTQLVGLYRSLTTDRRVLLIVDNAGSAEQVLPLVPAGTGSFTIVTSRQRLAALGTHHAVAFVSLDGLSEGESLGLLRKVVGPQRLDGEAEALKSVSRLCAGLPLALRIAGAKLASDPEQTAQQLADELSAGNRLDELSVSGDSRSVRTVFASAYRALPPALARLFRRAGTFAGPSFDAHLAAALAGVDLAIARKALTGLVAEHLLQPAGEGRYRFHDLIRLYAEECARRDETPTERADVDERMLDWYLAVAHAANQVIGRARDRVEPSVRFAPPKLPFESAHDEILSYLDSEHASMTPVVRFAAEHGHHTHAWQLTYLFTGFFEYRGYWTDRMELCRVGLASAQRLGNAFAEALMHGTLGVACVELHRYDEAVGHLRRAQERAEAVGDKRGQGVALNNMTAAYFGLRRYRDALEVACEALTLYRASGHRVGMAFALNNIGTVHARLGEAPRALEHLDEALAISRELGNARVEAIVLDSIGQTHLYAGCYPQALEWLGQALTARRGIGDRRNIAETLNLVGVTHLRAGDPTKALIDLREAEATSREVGDVHLESVILANLGETHLALDALSSAESVLRRALALRTRIPDPVEEAAIHRLLAELSDRSGDPGASQRHRAMAHQLEALSSLDP